MRKDGKGLKKQMKQGEKLKSKIRQRTNSNNQRSWLTTDKACVSDMSFPRYIFCGSANLIKTQHSTS